MNEHMYGDMMSDEEAEELYDDIMNSYQEYIEYMSTNYNGKLDVHPSEFLLEEPTK